MANRAPVSHRKQRRRPQASNRPDTDHWVALEQLWHCLCLCGNERVTTADKLRICRRDRTRNTPDRNHPSTGDTMNDPTKQDGR